MTIPDPRPAGRIRDPDLLAVLHREWEECALCYETAYSFGRLSLHHIHKHPRNDVRANLVMLCGDGVRGCHGRIEAHDPETRAALCVYILAERPDTILYLNDLLGGEEPTREWLHRDVRLPSRAGRAVASADAPFG